MKLAAAKKPDLKYKTKSENEGPQNKQQLHEYYSVLFLEKRTGNETGLLTWQRRTPVSQEEAGVHLGRKPSASC